MIEQDGVLYKYISFSRFIEMIELERLYLTNITLWEDPYESYPIIKSFGDRIPGLVPQIMSGNLVSAIQCSTLKSLYAQSWTYDNEESDAMWRIYSQDKLGVRIAIQLKDILLNIKEAVFKKNSEDIIINHYKVKYREKFDVKKYMTAGGKGTVFTDKDIYGLKRIAFEHEKEYRISCSLPINKIFKNEYYHDIEKLAKELNNIETPPVIHYHLPLNILKEVLLDPRAPKSHEETFMEYCNKRNFRQKKIVFKKSILYSI